MSKTILVPSFIMLLWLVDFFFLHLSFQAMPLFPWIFFHLPQEEEHSDEAGSKKCIKSDSVTAQQQIQTPYEWDDIGQALLVQGHIGTYYDIGYNITSISISDNGDNIALGITVCAHIPDDSKKGKDININSKVKVFRRVSRHGKEKWVQRGKDLKGFGNIVSLSNNGKVLGIGNDHDNNADHNKRSQWFDGGLITMFQYRKKIDDWFSMGSVHHGGAASSLFGSSASLPENYKRMAVGPAGHDGFDVTEAGSVRIYQRLFQNKTLQHSRDIIL